jgi:2-phosphosulfolactate phosphatase
VTPTGPADSSPNDQSAFRVRFDWGPAGLDNLAPLVDTVVIVDVLSFTTSVDVALGCGAVVFPYRWHDGSERAFAEENDAVVAGSRGEEGSWSLAPSSLVGIPIGTRLVLPSPNGSALTFGAAEAGASQVVAACIRNAAAVGAVFSDTDLAIGVVAAGERWQSTIGATRVALEDLLGAGAVLAGFDRDDLSPEARAAVAAWHEAEPDLRERLFACASGRQLAEAGWTDDVAIAAQAHVSDLVPTLDHDRFVDAGGS